MSKVGLLDPVVSQSGTGQQVGADVLALTPVELMTPKVQLAGAQTVAPPVVT